MALKTIEATLCKLVTVGLVRVYSYDRQPYLQLLAWEKHQTIRCKRSKFPPPPDDERLHAHENICKQMQADVPENPNPNPIRESESESISELPAGAYAEIVGYLNNTVGADFKASNKKTQSLINARMGEGFTVDDFKTVIDKKYHEWVKKPDMAQYLRPQTLFGTNFEAYLNQRVTDVFADRCKSNKADTITNPFLSMLERGELDDGNGLREADGFNQGELPGLPRPNG
jgi:uncharacterized phage protein (TIGR02220 family)